jgi:hypothetical protein
MVNLLLLLAACGGDAGPAAASGAGPDLSPGVDPATALPPMDDAALLTRASLDLRGVRPTLDELDRLAADPAQLDTLVQEYLDDPRFGDRVVDLYSEVFLTRADFYTLSAATLGLESQPRFARSVGEEPLQVLARIAREDLPYPELVTGDWTMADEVTASIWPVTHDGAPGWQVSRYTDGRPAAGVLATNGMWWRYTSTGSNANRKRANQISRIFLCNDYLVRPIEFDRDVDLLDQDAVEDAITNDPGCVSCHASLDPLAGYLFGFWTYNDQSFIDLGTYHPERERLWGDYLDTSPGYYGQPGDTLADLGVQIAQDPRFAQCAVETAWTLLLRRAPTVADTDALTAHREAFLAGELHMDALYASIVSDPRYRAADVDHPLAEEVGAVPLKLVTADLLASQIEDLTGFRWNWQEYDMLQTDVVGMRTLAGGADGVTVSSSATSPNATLVLVQERLAEAAAWHAVVTEMQAEPAARGLFTEVDLEATPVDDPAGATAQVQHLHRRIFGRTVSADSEEVAAHLALFDDLYALDASAPAAWAGVLTAMLRDPDLLLY